MIANPFLTSWIEHRFGKPQDYESWPRTVEKALELNRPEPDFARTLGKCHMRGFVGFIDIVGSSERIAGLSPERVAQH